MSGIYDIKRFMDGYYDEAVYFHNLVDFLANEYDPGRLDAPRRLDSLLADCRDDPLQGGNDFARIGDGLTHDWPIWARMPPLDIGGHD